MTDPYRYYCVYCMKMIMAIEPGLFVHDDVPHPADADFDDEDKPQ